MIRTRLGCKRIMPFKTPFYGYEYGPKIPSPLFVVFGSRRGIDQWLGRGPHRHRIEPGMPIAGRGPPFRPEDIDWYTGRPHDGWERIKFATCDLCTKRAMWEHPKGGLRCHSCPRPV